MLALVIIFSAMIVIVAYFSVKNYLWRKKILKAWEKESSPDILKLLDYAKNKAIIINFARFKDWEVEHAWAAHLSGIIIISVNAETGRIMPNDYFLQKIIFAHEICHLKQEREFFEVKFSCKHFLGNPCLFLELANWKNTFAFLQKLDLLHNDEEKNKFWYFVHSKPKQEIFAACLQKAEDSSCPKSAELKEILKQFPK